MENLENSEFLSRLVKLYEFGFFKEVINFRDHSKVVLVLQKFVVATSKM